MTNKERQQQLDRQKYYAGISKNRDMRGEMPYCNNCKIKCKEILQEEMEEKSYCARAYNRLKK